MNTTYTNSEFQDILIYFANSIFGQNTEEEIAWDLAKNCISSLGFEDCVVYFVDESDGVLIQKAAYGPKNPRQFEIANPITILMGQGITGNAAKNARSELIGDTSLDNRYIVDDVRRFSEITVPIVIEGRVFGVIDCEHSEKHFFNDQHLKILEAIASICSVKISKVRAERISKEKERHLLNIQKELLTLKIEALRTQINPHFLFNAISSIQYFITIGDKKSALTFLSIFSKLIRYYLNHFEKDEVTIGGELQLMQWYLALQKMRYTDKFDFKIHSLINDHQASQKVPSMILGSFTESILETSVFDNVARGKIKIKIKCSGEKLYVTALHILSKNNEEGRLVNYRKNMASWEEQVSLLNRLRNLAIEKDITRRLSFDKSFYIEKINIVIPVIE